MSRTGSGLIHVFLPAMAILFAVETAVMFLLAEWGVVNTSVALIDAGLVVCLAAPFLHVFVLGPLLRRHRIGQLVSAALLEGTVDGVIRMDGRGIIRSVNPAAAALFGYTPSELVGHPLGMLQLPEDRAPHRQGVKRYIRTGHKLVVGSRTVVNGLHKDGTPISIELSVSEIAPRPAPVFLGILRDVTQRERKEKALRLTHCALESSGHAVFLLTRDGAILDANQPACDVAGATRDELHLKSVGDR